MSVAHHTILLSYRTLLALTVLVMPASPTKSGASENGDCSLGGTVILEMEKRPASGVVVTARSVPDGPSLTVLTQDDGSFDFRALSPGIYDVFAVESGGYVSLHVTTQLHHGSRTLQLSLKSPSASRVPVAGSIVSVHQLRIPAKARASFEQGFRRLRGQQPAESLSYFREAIHLYPSFYEAYHGIGLANLSLVHYTEAAEAFQRAIDLSDHQYLLSDFSMGVVLWQNKKLPQAEAVLRGALAKDPSYAYGHLYLSAVLYDEDRLQDAETSARAAILRDPNLTTAYLIQARIYGRWGNTDKQLSRLEKYLSLRPDDEQHSVRNLYDALKSSRISADSTPPH